MRKKIINSCLIILLIFNSGCWSSLNINDTAVCSGLGVDITDTGKISVMVQINKSVNPQNEEGKLTEGAFIVVSGSGNSITEASRKITLSLPRMPIWSHADLFLLGENLVTEDLSILYDFLFRNRNIRKSSYALVANKASLGKIYNSDCPMALCSARGILKILFSQEKNLGIYLPVTIKDFLIMASTPGIDPFLPMVTVRKDLEDKDILTLDGTAIFKNNKMVGELNEAESRGLYWLNTKTAGSCIVVTLSDNPENKVSLQAGKINSKIRPRIKDNELVMDITCNVDFNITEIIGIVDEEDEELMVKIQNAANKKVASHIRQAVVKGQKTNSDFLGFGLSISRYQPKLWKNIGDDWENRFPSVRTNIEVKSNLLRSNLIFNDVFLVNKKGGKP